MKVKIPQEWYEILLKASEQKRMKFSQFVDYMFKTEECLNLPEVPTSGRVRSLTLPGNVDEKELVRKIHKFLFCS